MTLGQPGHICYLCRKPVEESETLEKLDLHTNLHTKLASGLRLHIICAHHMVSEQETRGLTPAHGTGAIEEKAIFQESIDLECQQIKSGIQEEHESLYEDFKQVSQTVSNLLSNPSWELKSVQRLCDTTRRLLGLAIRIKTNLRGFVPSSDEEQRRMTEATLLVDTAMTTFHFLKAPIDNSKKENGENSSQKTGPMQRLLYFTDRYIFPFLLQSDALEETESVLNYIIEELAQNYPPIQELKPKSRYRIGAKILSSLIEEEMQRGRDIPRDIVAKFPAPPLKEESPSTHPLCPRCRSKDVIPIVYGYLPHLVEEEKKGRFLLGGCVIDVNSPRWHCKNCNGDWNDSEKLQILGSTYDPTSDTIALRRDSGNLSPC